MYEWKYFLGGWSYLWIWFESDKEQEIVQEGTWWGILVEVKAREAIVENLTWEETRIQAKGKGRQVLRSLGWI